jgi:hypothetical protein
MISALNSRTKRLRSAHAGPLLAVGLVIRGDSYFSERASRKITYVMSEDSHVPAT